MEPNKWSRYEVATLFSKSIHSNHHIYFISFVIKFRSISPRDIRFHLYGDKVLSFNNVISKKKI